MTDYCVMMGSTTDTTLAALLSGLRAAHIVELVTWLAVLQLLQRLNGWVQPRP